MGQCFFIPQICRVGWVGDSSHKTLLHFGDFSFLKKLEKKKIAHKRNYPNLARTQIREKSKQV